MANTHTSTGLPENVSGLLCYLFFWVSGVVFLVIERSNKTVRFHAAQSIVVFAALTALNAIVPVLPFLGKLLSAVVWAATFLAWVSLMILAGQGRQYKVPILGPIAEKLA